jgi:hypothetical protein
LQHWQERVQLFHDLRRKCGVPHPAWLLVNGSLQVGGCALLLVLGGWGNEGQCPGMEGGGQGGKGGEVGGGRGRECMGEGLHARMGGGEKGKGRAVSKISPGDQDA